MVPKAPTYTGPKFKCLFWRKLNDERGLWSSVTKLAPSDIDDEWMRRLFEVKPVDASKSAAPAAQSTADAATSRAFGAQRRQNIGIVLKKTKLTADVVVAALIACNSMVLSEEVLEALCKCIPTDEEAKVLGREFGTAAQAAWSAPEITMHAITTRVPDYRERLTLWTAVIELPYLVEEAERQVALLQKATEAATTPGSKIERLLHLVLHLGNYVNRGSQHGDAKGFKLDSLSGLSMVKSVDGKHTLLHAVAFHGKRLIPDVTELLPLELAPLRDVQSVTLASLSTSVGQVNQASQRIRKSVAGKTGGATTSPLLVPGDGMPAVLSACYESFGQRASLLLVGYQTLKGDVAAMLEFFGESPSDDEGVVFNTLLVFADQFVTAVKSLAAPDK